MFNEHEYSWIMISSIHWPLWPIHPQISWYRHWYRWCQFSVSSELNLLHCWICLLSLSGILLCICHWSQGCHEAGPEPRSQRLYWLTWWRWNIIDCTCTCWKLKVTSSYYCCWKSCWNYYAELFEISVSCSRNLLKSCDVRTADENRTICRWEYSSAIKTKYLPHHVHRMFEEKPIPEIQ